MSVQDRLRRECDFIVLCFVCVLVGLFVGLFVYVFLGLLCVFASVFLCLLCVVGFWLGLVDFVIDLFRLCRCVVLLFYFVFVIIIVLMFCCLIQSRA